MPQKDVVKKLKALAQLDVDASHAYQQAIDRITLPEVKEQLTRFKEDHERHVREISHRLKEMGEDAPKPTPDMKGYLIETFTALRSMMGNEGALKAMKTNEHTTTKKYDEARKMDANPEIHTLLEANYADEERHLHYVEQAIKDRVWEKA